MGFAEDFRLGLQRPCCLPALCARRVQWGAWRNGHLCALLLGPSIQQGAPCYVGSAWDPFWLGSLGRSDFSSTPLLYEEEVHFIKIAWILPLLFLVHKILEKSFSQWLPPATRDSFASPPVCCPAHRFSHIHTKTNSCEFLGMTSASHGVIRSVLSLQQIRRNLFIFLNTSVQSSVLDNALWC